MKPCLLLSSLTLCLGLAPVQLLAQENQELGRMWTFENPPLAYLEKEYGFKPDQKWLNSLRLASLRLGGETVDRGFCSASFVSPKGLIMTNNHCIRDAVNATSGAGRNGADLVKSGFYAKAQSDEYRLKTDDDGWLTVSQLNQITSVTERVNKGITASDTEDEVKEKRKANREAILDEAKKADPKLVPQIVSLYQGGIFQLYQYRVFSDIRLVCMPHLQTAHFGGDPDNFTYPRYSIDYSFLRAYEDGEPADTTKFYYKWKSGGAKEGELVFVPGNPGSTNRLNTKAQMEFDRDVKLPILVEMLTNRLKVFRALIKRIPRVEDAFRTQMLGWENGEKAITGNIHGLHDAALLAQKTAAEKSFKARVMKDKELAAKYGDLWDKLAAVAAERRVHQPLDHFHGVGNCRTLATAYQLVSAFDPEDTEESRKENQAGLADLRVGREDAISVPIFNDHVQRAQKWLSKDDPFFTKVLGGMTARQFITSIMRSRLGSEEFRQKLTEGGWKTIEASDDPAIVAARELLALTRENDKKSEDLDAREEALGAALGRALFATYGTDVSPDATMTPRFTDGVVKGYKFNGTIAPYRTTFYGLYARNAEFDNEYPFNIPQAWKDGQSKIDMTKSVNFVSTNDITGGNSGSVVVNRDLEVVGLIFDGNIESLHNDYVFKEDVPRSVSVHVDGIVEAMAKIYNAIRVVEELTGPQGSKSGDGAEKENGWQPMFDGESLVGWTQRNGTATYRIEGDSIVGKTVDGSPNSFLCTDKLYGDFEMTFEVKVDPQLNSGVQIRSQTRGGFKGRVNGPQVEIEASGKKGAEAGYIYGEAAGGWMTPAKLLVPHKTFKDGKWNAYRILAVGANIKVWINGVAISDLTDEKKFKSHPLGFIALQVHGIRRGAGPFEVRWRNLRIREVK